MTFPNDCCPRAECCICGITDKPPSQIRRVRDAVQYSAGLLSDNDLRFGLGEITQSEWAAARERSEHLSPRQVVQPIRDELNLPTDDEA